MYTPGVVSRQLLNPDKSNSKRVTITEVHLEVNACQPRHTHEASEQIWYATKGRGKLLIAKNENVNLVLYYGHFQKNKFSDRNKEFDRMI